MPHQSSTHMAAEHSPSPAACSGAGHEILADRYLETMKYCLADAFHLNRVTAGKRRVIVRNSLSPKQLLIRWLSWFCKQRKIGLYYEDASDRPDAAIAARENGTDWPDCAETMIGLKRLTNLKTCVTDVIRNGVPGDLIETGVWRGGATIFMRAILLAHQVTDRVVWVADSFEGLPKPNPEQYPEDTGDTHHLYEQLQVTLEDVQRNFAKYGLLDEQVRFLKGWFKDTLPVAPIEKLSVLRLDGDMYESTMDAFRALYHKLSPGGYCIVDDYGAVVNCRKATDDFRQQQQIIEPLQAIDGSGVFWQKRS